MYNAQASLPGNAEIFWIEDETHGIPAADVGAKYTVGELAAALKVTPRALRFYESKGLLSPMRSEGMRLYRNTDRDRVLLILKAKKFGFTLLEIKQMIEAQAGQKPGQSMRLSLAKCSEQIKVLERQRGEVDEALAELRRIHTMLLQQDAGR